MLDLLAQPHNSRPYVQIGTIRAILKQEPFAHPSCAGHGPVDFKRPELSSDPCHDLSACRAIK
jgi:hypothetical protein